MVPLCLGSTHSRDYVTLSRADVTRGWCVFELWYAITLSRKCDLSIILAPEDRAAFNERINADGTDAHAIDEALAVVDSERAEAYSEDDLDKIRGKIKTLAGGFAMLDNTIKGHLRRWFVSQGGVKANPIVILDQSTTVLPVPEISDAVDTGRSGGGFDEKTFV